MLGNDMIHGIFDLKPWRAGMAEWIVCAERPLN